MISSSFWKTETKNLNSDPGILISLALEITSRIHIGYLNIGSGHEIEAAIHGLS